LTSLEYWITRPSAQLRTRRVMTTEYDFAISPHHLPELFHQPFGTSVASWFETALKRLLTMRVESNWRATTRDSSLLPLWEKVARSAG